MVNITKLLETNNTRIRIENMSELLSFLNYMQHLKYYVLYGSNGTLDIPRALSVVGSMKVDRGIKVEIEISRSRKGYFILDRTKEVFYDGSKAIGMNMFKEIVYPESEERKNTMVNLYKYSINSLRLGIYGGESEIKDVHRGDGLIFFRELLKTEEKICPEILENFGYYISLIMDICFYGMLMSNDILFPTGCIYNEYYEKGVNKVDLIMGYIEDLIFFGPEVNDKVVLEIYRLEKIIEKYHNQVV